MDWGLLAATALIWGSSFLLIGVAVRDMPPVSVAFLRLAFGVVTLAIIPASRRAVPRSEWRPIAVVGAVWMAAPFVLFSIALQWIDTSLAGMLNAAAPLCTAVDGDRAAINWILDYVGTDGKRYHFDQIALQTWRGQGDDAQIVHERFVYDSATLVLSDALSDDLIVAGAT